MRRSFTIIAISVAILAIAATGAWYVIDKSHEPVRIGDGEVYRSAQPSPHDLQVMKQHHGLRTVVNLRGRNENDGWYRSERDEAARLGVRLADVPFESFDSPPRIETLMLLDELSTAERPILMHCESGIDRSGWAAGVVRLLEGASVDEAEKQLQHWCDRKTCPLHEFFDSYRAWLKKSSVETNADNFRRWVLEDYYPEPYRAQIHATAPPPNTVAAGSTVTFEVEITNASASPWSAGNDMSRGIRPGARILGPFETVPDDAIGLFRSPENLYQDVFRDHNEGIWPPGETRTIAIAFNAPDQPGMWVIQVDMVHEMVHWFCDLGDPGLMIPIRVE